MNQNSYDGRPSLYLVPTPIGNLEDITIRSLNVLKMVDLILCEDTRETLKLLSFYDIKKKLVSCHKYNEEKMKSVIVSKLDEGLNLALVTDQGTPIISDPGYTVVNEVIKNNYNVIGLPGATAFVPALISSGISPSPFLFYGFLNAKSSKQLKELESLKILPYTIILYESVHRLNETLKNIYTVLGDRYVSIHREISKIHEEIIRDKVSNLIDNITTLKGEFVLVVSGNTDLVDFSDMSLYEHVMLYVNDGMSKNEAIKLVAKERGISKSIVYKEVCKDK